MKRKSRIFAYGAVMSAMTLSSFVQAQTLEEIVVTAQKRTESLQDVPISISTISGAKIEEAGINNLEDLTAFVPNMQLTENAVATSIIMRGVGPGANQSFEQSVGLYVDGIHLGKGRQSRTGLFDLDRVEVLRGPQGILFGKNTLAGAVNVTSASPEVGQEFSGKFAVSGESYGTTSIEGHIAGSVTENLALRLAVKDYTTDGYLDNTFTGADGPAIEETLWRLSAKWEPSENLSMTFKHAEGENVRRGATSVVRVFEPTPNLSPSAFLGFFVVNNFFPQLGMNVENGALDTYRDAIALGGRDLSNSLGDSVGSDERPEGTDTDTKETSLNIEYDFGNGMTFTSVTGYSEYEYTDGLDADFLPIRFIGRSDDSEFDNFSQEFRIASDPSERFSYIAGAYYQDSTQEIDRIVAFDGQLGLPGSVVTALTGAPTLLALPPATAGFLGLPPFVNGLSSFNQIARVSNWRQETESWAVFLQGEYEINDNLKLTAGVRYTEEDKDAFKFARITNDAGGLANPSTNPLTGAVVRGITPTTYNHDYVDTRSTDQLMPGVTLEWSRDDDNLYYASYAEGFKSGGFNSVDDQSPTAADIADNDFVNTQPGSGWRYEDETAQSLEIGGKHTLRDGSMSLNWALFTSEYDDQQVSTFVGVGFEVRNAATSEVDGLEIDWRWQASDNLLVGANVALLDAKYGAFPAAGCTALQLADIAGGATSSGACALTTGADGNPFFAQNLAGRQLPNAPDYSGTLFFDYKNELNDNWSWFLSGDINFTDGYFLAGDLDPIDFQDSFQKVNVRLGFRNENLEVMLYGRNITDENTASGGFDVPLLSGAHAVYTDPGEQYGIRVGLSF